MLVIKGIQKQLGISQTIVLQSSRDQVIASNNNKRKDEKVLFSNFDQEFLPAIASDVCNCDEDYRLAAIVRDVLDDYRENGESGISIVQIAKSKEKLTEEYIRQHVEYKIMIEIMKVLALKFS